MQNSASGEQGVVIGTGDNVTGWGIGTQTFCRFDENVVASGLPLNTSSGRINSDWNVRAGFLCPRPVSVLESLRARRECANISSFEPRQQGGSQVGLRNPPAFISYPYHP